MNKKKSLDRPRRSKR